MKGGLYISDVSERWGTTFLCSLTSESPERSTSDRGVTYRVVVCFEIFDDSQNPMTLNTKLTLLLQIPADNFMVSHPRA